MTGRNDEQPLLPFKTLEGFKSSSPDDNAEAHPPHLVEDEALQSQLRSLDTHSIRRALLWAAGYDDPLLIAACPPGEIASAMTRGALMYLYVIILMIEFNVIAHHAMRSSFSLPIIAASAFLAAFFGLVDSYVLLRAPGFKDGMTGMLRGGFGIDVRLGTNFMSSASRFIRVGLMVLMASDLTLFAGLWLNEARIAKEEFSQNSVALQKGMKNFDARRDAALRNYETAVASQKSLSPEVDRLVQQSNRNSSAKNADKLASNEARLEKANAKVADAASALEEVDAARTAELEKLRKSPGWIPRDDSLINRIQALIDEIRSRPLAALGMAFIGLVILGTDLVMLSLKGIAMPSAYAMMDTRRHLGLMVQQARLAQAETTAREAPLAPEETPLSTVDGSLPPPRRGPGRPPGSKNKTRLNGQGDVRHG